MDNTADRIAALAPSRGTNYSMGEKAWRSRPGEGRNITLRVVERAWWMGGCRELARGFDVSRVHAKTWQEEQQFVTSSAVSAITATEQRNGRRINDGKRINYLGVGVAAAAAFVASGLWYSPLLFGNLYMSVRGAEPGVMSPTEILIELGRTLVVAYVFAHLVVRLGVRDWLGAVRFGLLVWIGFPVMILLGSVAHENVPLQLAAIHAGDWLVKVVILAVVPSLWRAR
jgi:hypothetical protein